MKVSKAALGEAIIFPLLALLIVGADVGFPMDGRTVAILLLIVALILHLIEEVKTGFRKRLPIGEMPLLVFVGLNVVIYAFCFATLALSLRTSQWAVPLAWVFAVSMVLNGLGHIGIMLIKKEYFPGGLTAFLLLLASGYLILQLRL